jgi:hypothetical protein
VLLPLHHLWHLLHLLLLCCLVLHQRSCWVDQQLLRYCGFLELLLQGGRRNQEAGLQLIWRLKMQQGQRS